MIKIVHIADIHLENLDHGQLPNFKSRLEENRYESLNRAIDLAVSKRADLFIIAGDLFDGQKITLKAVMFINDCLKYLIDQGVRPVIVMGNHDPMTFYDQWDIQLPDECIVFGPEPERILLTSADGEKFTLNGCSHEEVGIIDNRGARFPVASPKMVNIGVLHGSVSSWVDDEEPYMPCSVEELANKQYHLWCLGHIHKRKEIREINGFYPGGLIGNKLDEVGPKGAYYHEINRGHLSYEFVPISEMMFERVDVNMDMETDRHSIDELMMHLDKRLDLVRKKSEIDTGVESLKLVVDLRISGRSNLFYRLNDSSAIKYIEEHLEDKSWIEKVFIDTKELLPDVDMGMVAQSGSFPGFCMELLKDPDFAKNVLERIDSQSLAAKTLFSNVEEENLYRRNLLEHIENDVIRHLLRDEEIK
jgi:DNA repair exonuclease SbcCD nuclease subunit